MNERIRELIIQTDEWLENNAQSNRYEREIKFAELIVQECIAQVRRDENGPAYEAVGRIAGHFFGVEE